MTVTSTTARNNLVGTGVTTVFPYTFRILAATDLEVIVRDPVTELETTLSYPADYSVSGVGNTAGGSATLVTPPANGAAVTLRRVVPLTQQTSFRAQGTFRPESHEEAFDRLTMIAQEHDDRLDRAFRLPPSTLVDGAVSPVLPAPDPGAALVWNSIGGALENRTLSDSAVALPGNGRTVGSLTTYLANNAVFNVRDYGAVGDGTTDDTAAIQTALTNAGLVGGVVYFPPGTYASSTASLSGTFASRKTIAVVGAGKHLSFLTRRVTSPVQQTQLLDFNWCDVRIEGMGFNHGNTTGANVSSVHAVDVYKARTLRVHDCDFKYAQYNALQISACTDIVVTGCSFASSYYGGISVGGGLEGDNTLPYGATRLVITGNTFDTIYAGVLVQVYVDEVAIMGNVFTKAGIQIGQPVNRLAITGNTINGTNITFGAYVQIVVPPPDGIFVEGDYDVAVTGNVLYDVEGRGIYVVGSDIDVTPNGPVEGALPVRRVLVAGNVVVGATLDSILVQAISTGAGPTDGEHIAVTGNLVVSGSAAGISMNTCNGGLIGGNYVAKCGSNGINLSQCEGILVQGNQSKNNSQLLANTYNGIMIDDASLRNTLIGNECADDQTVHTQRSGILDNVLSGGVASLTRYRDNVFYGNLLAPITPAPAIPTLGTWVVGDRIENPNATVGKALGWRCIAAGTPGTWVAEAMAAGISSDRGDASVTLNAGTDATTQRFGTALTATRSVTCSNTGAWPGAKFRILRQNGATGAFNLDIKNNGGATIKSLTAASTWADVEYDATFGWFVVASGSL